MAIVGAGRAGTAFGVLLERAGDRVVAASGGPSTAHRVAARRPGAAFFEAGEAHRAAALGDLVILGVPDDAIEAVCSEIAARQAFRPGQWVIHLSGSLGLDVLEPAAARGAGVVSLHPLQTFPDVDAGVSRLPGSTVAVTGRTDAAVVFGERLALRIGGEPFRLGEEVKPLYHSAAVFCSNYLVAVEGIAEALFRLAGLEEPVRMFAPLARASLEATLARGPSEALTGPAARGDIGTIRRNLTALRARAPEAVGAYLALAAVASNLALRAGRLSEQQARRVEEELGRWR